MDISEYCQLCKHSNDQMLMLSCDHDPCINCAASAYAEMVHIKNNDPHIYSCEVCASETALDTSTIAQLNNLSKSYVKVPSPSKGNRSTAVGGSGSLEKTKRSVQAGKQTAYFCRVHSEQELTYYCFTCHQNICPECTIHGSHKDHEVKLIKKAINDAKAEFVDVVSQIGAAQNNMAKYKDGFKRTIREANQRNNREKSLVSQEFELLRNALTNKEREIIRDLDAIHKQNLATFNDFVDHVDKLNSEIQKTKKEIQTILHRDQVMVFEDYKRIPSFEEKATQLKKESQEIVGDALVLNSEILQQEMKAIQENIRKFQHSTKKEPISSLAVAGKASTNST